MSLANPGLKEHKAQRNTVKKRGQRVSTGRSLQAAPTAHTSLLSHLTTGGSMQLGHLLLASCLAFSLFPSCWKCFLIAQPAPHE